MIYDAVPQPYEQVFPVFPGEGLIVIVCHFRFYCFAGPVIPGNVGLFQYIFTCVVRVIGVPVIDVCRIFDGAAPGVGCINHQFVVFILFGVELHLVLAAYCGETVFGYEVLHFSVLINVASYFVYVIVIVACFYFFIIPLI